MTASTSSINTKLLACFFESMTSVAESAIYCVLVEAFPTRLRIMATSLGLTVGRAGALFGSLMFGYLVNFNCLIPIITFSLLLFASAIVSYFLPHGPDEGMD